jgi:hypothetical protein
MTLSSREMKQLELHSASFVAEGHNAYLSEAINAAQTSGRPDMALQLLKAMSGDARGNQQQAILDVCRWIERRLREEPSIPAERFLLELGWLRRLCVARLADRGSHHLEQRGEPQARKRK